MNRSKNYIIDESKLTLSDFEIISHNSKDSLLGKGSFAAVYLARCKKNNRKYAMKIVR